MDEKRSKKAHLNALALILCIVQSVQSDMVRSHMCTAGADYKFCHTVIPTSSAKQEFPIIHLVNTVDHCRDICDKEGCSAFEYQASANNRQQQCILYLGIYESIQLVPDFHLCNDKEWRYSWKRPTEKSKGHCLGKRSETLQIQLPWADNGCYRGHSGAEVAPPGAAWTTRHRPLLALMQFWIK